MAKIERPWPYLAAVNGLQAQYPVLKTVSGFMTRPSRFEPKLSILEFTTDSVKEVKIASSFELADYWNSEIADNSAGRPGVQGRLYLVENLSAEYLEALGGHFNINPIFFLRHFYEPIIHKHQRIDPANCPPQQLHCGMHQDSTGLSLRYIDTFLRNGPPERWAKFTACNARRKFTVTKPFPYCNSMLTILRNVSLHVVPVDSDGPWSAILLVDAPVTTHWIISELGPTGRRDRLELCHFRPYMSPLVTSEDLWRADVITSHPTKDGLGPSQPSPFEFITDFWNRRATLSDIKAANQSPSDTLKSLMTRAILPSWMNLLSLLSATLSNHEYSMFEFEKISPKTSEQKVKAELVNLREALGNISRSRRRTWWFIEHMHVSLQNLGYPTGRVDLQDCDKSSGPPPAIRDFAVVMDRFYYMKERIDSLITIVHGACGILEAQQSALETKHFNALTTLAAVFVPITTCAGIFSMGDGFMPGEPKFWIFWATAVPLTALVILIIFNLSTLHSTSQSVATRLKNWRQ